MLQKFNNSPLFVELATQLGVVEEHVKQHGIFNAFEYAMVKAGEHMKATWTHQFLEGFYLRTIHMPAGSVIMSCRHATWNPYVITKGNVLWAEEKTGTLTHVVTDGTMNEHFASVTEPGTRRLLYNIEDTDWTTFHSNPDNITDIARLEALLTVPNDNPLLLTL
jgi:hypothetical protein